MIQKKTSCISYISYVLVILTLSSGALAEEPAEVMLMGTFHFSAPGKDAVKTEKIDVTTTEPQQYLETLAEKISASFEPTRVLLEFVPESNQKVNERYQRFLEGEFELGVNEVYQLGFRIARNAGLERIEGFDDREIGWEAKPMLDYAKEHEPEAHKAFEDRIASVTKRKQAEQDTLSLEELLLANNSVEDFAANKALYIDTNEIGAGKNFLGAAANAGWWHRNFRMYALVQQAAQPGERVFVLAGSGHIAILRDLLELDRARRARDVRPLIEAAGE